LLASHQTGGEGTMIPVLIASIVLVGLGSGGVWLGLQIVRVLREQFDELMPERMVEYSGFVQFPLGRD
jgi:hypothetical protein